jgi:hypothetical protein
VRGAISKGFFTKEKVKVAEEDTDKGLEFTGFQGRRDDEVVPQIFSSNEPAEKLKEFVSLMREVSKRNETISEKEWNSRFILRKATMQTIDMHRSASRNSGRAFDPDSEFTLLEPLTDLMQAKRYAEQQQEEEDRRKREGEEMKRRKKEEEQRRKMEDKKNKKTEDMRRKQEDQRLAAEAKKFAKGKGKGGKAQQKAAEQAARAEQEAWARQQQAPQAKGKAKAEAKAKKKQDQQQKGGKGAGSKDLSSTSSSQQGPGASYGKGGGGGDIPSLSPPWVAVPDPSSGRFYYWNQQTNEVSWTSPSGSGSASNSPSSQQAQANMWMMQQQQAFMQQMMQYGAGPGFQ